MSRRKYSDLILEEAFKLSLLEGDAYASRKTGVDFDVVRKYVRKRRRQLGIWSRHQIESKDDHPPGKNASSTADKVACIHLALKLYNGGYYKKIGAALEAAGKKFNINGIFLMAKWRGDEIYPSFSEAQQPSTRVAGAGDSSQTAKPQAQSLIEQCRALKSLWPAARISRRREYTGPRFPKDT